MGEDEKVEGENDGIRGKNNKNNNYMSTIIIPSGSRHIGNFTNFDKIIPINKKSNCNTLCFTYSKNYMYKPHSGYGMVGTTATSYLARRKRL